MGDDKRSAGVYESPGLETVVLVLPSVAIIAVICALVTGLLGGPEKMLKVGLVAFIIGIVAWVGIWELFSRLHPRLSTGSGEQVKWSAILIAPPVIAALAAVVAAAG